MQVLPSEHEIDEWGRSWQHFIHVDGISVLSGILLVMARLHQMAERSQYVPHGLFWTLWEMIHN